MAVLQFGEQLDGGVFEEERHRADGGYMFKLFVLVHLGADILGAQDLLQLCVKDGGHGL